MAENENTFLNADHIYEDVEGEQGKTLNLNDIKRYSYQNYS